MVKLIFMNFLSIASLSILVLNSSCDCFGQTKESISRLYFKYQSHMWGDPQGRALFDMAAVAILKNSDWAESYIHPAPIFKDGQWVERPNNPRKITIWEWFDIYTIPADFFYTMDNYVIAERP